MAEFTKPAGKPDEPVNVAELVDKHKAYMAEKGLYPEGHPNNPNTQQTEQPKE